MHRTAAANTAAKRVDRQRQRDQSREQTDTETETDRQRFFIVTVVFFPVDFFFALDEGGACDSMLIIIMR